MNKTLPPLDWQTPIVNGEGAPNQRYILLWDLLRNPLYVYTPYYTIDKVPDPVEAGIGAMIYVRNPSSSSRPYWSDGFDWRDAVGTLLS